LGSISQPADVAAAAATESALHLQGSLIAWRRQLRTSSAMIVAIENVAPGINPDRPDHERAGVDRQRDAVDAA
jgi:hypothetical protein